MLKCPYCYETLPEKILRCPHCLQFIIDEIVTSDFPSMDKKSCVFCGKKILAEAKICRYCQKWLDELDRRLEEVDPEDLV
jgi:hypothetical protein